MSKINEFREGYKKTEAGWIPNDWEAKQIREIAELNPNNHRKYSDETRVSFIPMAQVSEDGKIINQQIRHYAEVSKGYTYFADGDMLVAKITPCFENGKGALVSGLENGIGFGSTEFHVLRSKDVNSSFLFIHTRSHKFRKTGVTNMTGSVGQKRIPTYFLGDYWLGIPALVEQRKIVEIINTWENGIERVQRLIEAKQQQKARLVAQLLSGKICFPGLHDEWQQVKLSTFLHLKLRKVEKPNKAYLRLGIRSHGKGTFTSVVDDPETISMTHLYQARKDDLIVNITFAWEGAIALVGPDGDGALVSHRFPTYVFDTSKMLPEFFKHLMVTDRFFYELDLISPGGAGRNRVMNKGDFLKIMVTVPDIEEQKKIAGVLGAMDDQIDTLKKYLGKLQKQKNSLMQKLLTGEIRVKVN
jgi:type I restriction enzyme, S subunit